MVSKQIQQVCKRVMSLPELHKQQPVHDVPHCKDLVMCILLILVTLLVLNKKELERRVHTLQNKAFVRTDLSEGINEKCTGILASQKATLHKLGEIQSLLAQEDGVIL
jgi:hypothetical protein